MKERMYTPYNIIFVESSLEKTPKIIEVMLYGKERGYEVHFYQVYDCAQKKKLLKEQK